MEYDRCEALDSFDIITTKAVTVNCGVRLKFTCMQNSEVHFWNALLSSSKASMSAFSFVGHVRYLVDNALHPMLLKVMILSY